MSDPLAHVRLGDPDPTNTIADVIARRGVCHAVAPPSTSADNLPYLCTREHGHEPFPHVASDGAVVVALWSDEL